MIFASVAAVLLGVMAWDGWRRYLVRDVKAEAEALRAELRKMSERLDKLEFRHLGE